MSKSSLVCLHSLPLLLGIICSYLFWNQPTLLLIIYLVITALVVFSGKDVKAETSIALYGLVAGFIIEVTGTQISGYQSFATPQVFGIPYWLIVSWAFGFILMKRIGLIIATGQPYASNQT